jgi:hypothetical protein
MGHFGKPNPFFSLLAFKCKNSFKPIMGLYVFHKAHHENRMPWLMGGQRIIVHYNTASPLRLQNSERFVNL